MVQLVAISIVRRSPRFRTAVLKLSVAIDLDRDDAPWQSSHTIPTLIRVLCGKTSLTLRHELPRRTFTGLGGVFDKQISYCKEIYASAHGPAIGRPGMDLGSPKRLPVERPKISLLLGRVPMHGFNELEVDELEGGLVSVVIRNQDVLGFYIQMQQLCRFSATCRVLAINERQCLRHLNEESPTIYSGRILPNNDDPSTWARRLRDTTRELLRSSRGLPDLVRGDEGLVCGGPAYRGCAALEQTHRSFFSQEVFWRRIEAGWMGLWRTACEQSYTQWLLESILQCRALKLCLLC